MASATSGRARGPRNPHTAIAHRAKGRRHQRPRMPCS
jgi:hypothetical protein